MRREGALKVFSAHCLWICTRAGSCPVAGRGRIRHRGCLGHCSHAPRTCEGGDTMCRSGSLACRASVVVVAALALPGLAKAAIVPLTNPNQFSGNETLLTFQGVQPFQNVTSLGGVGFQTLGLPPGTGLSG